MKPREFSSDILYPTEHEADIHGIAFGQQLIDGKVDGRSVTDMKINKRREIRRFNVQFSTTVSDHTKHEGSGLMLDLSLGGCQLESQSIITPRKTVQLHVQVPGLERPLVIDGADMRWVKGQLIGLAFVRVRKTEQQ
jgi:PilZ domain